MLPARALAGRDEAHFSHFSPRPIVLIPSEVYMRQETIFNEEIYLAAFEPVTGALIEECRLALMPGTIDPADAHRPVPARDRHQRPGARHANRMPAR